jgi:hypothetical protein
VGTAASVALVAVGWYGLREHPNPGTPVPTELAQRTTAPLGADPLDALREDPNGRAQMTPEMFSQRVVMTLGGADNPGTSLDMTSGDAVTERWSGAYPPVPTQVGMGLTPLEPQSRAQAEPVVSYGCGENPAEGAFMAALKAEEAGNLELAAQGYKVVRSSVAPTHPLYAEAHYRLNYLAWQHHMRQLAGMERAQLMAKLNRVATQRYQSWLKTKAKQDCRDAWCMNRVLLSISSDVSGGAELQQTSERVDLLKDCVNQ